MTDVPLFEDPKPPEEEDDLSVPKPTNLPAWLAADKDRKVAILAPDVAQAQTWAAARGVPVGRYTVVRSVGVLYGMLGDEHALVRVAGPGGPVRPDRRMQNAIDRCRSGDVWVLDDVIPMEAEAEVSKTIGGVEILTYTSPPTVRVVPRQSNQGDVFVLVVDGEGMGIPRDALAEMVEVIAAWRESRPYVDAAAAQAAEIRAAVLAAGDPFAGPSKR